ncbi:transglutaminase family protein, partial [Rhizobium ruizarguesonis]
GTLIARPGSRKPGTVTAWLAIWPCGDVHLHWHTVDARHNTPRIGRILMATGRDATDVAMSTAFGPATLSRFEVITEEVPPEPVKAD